ncbi:MAG: aminotransferase class I/II-fold pyridoxal phosphate-dependent enzyme [Taibaiella sp.]|nr:aminotransferase class I/II-fold pyridoxal phosphate-dependent enzyme [Taibaiella sp.]
MSQLSHLAETLIGSEIVRLGNEINARIKNGEKIYNYTIGDFDPEIFPIPKELEEGIIAAYKDRYTNYPPGDGLLELRNAVAHYIKQQEGLQYAANEILIASGGRPLIYSLFKTIVNKNDKVIYAVPSWNNNHYVHMNGGLHCVVPAYPENNFMPAAADVAPHIAGAALLCLCTPQNPTGTTLNKSELQAICDLVIEENKRRAPNEKKLYVMFDQMYFALTYGNTMHHDPVSLRPEMKDYTIYIDGISKAFAATGVRVGWAFGPANVMGKMKALLSHIGAWAPMAEQKAVSEFLLKDDAIAAFFATFKAGLQERLHLIYDGFIALRDKGFAVDAVTPMAAIYLTVKIDLKGKHAGDRVLASQVDVTDYLLNEAKLAIVPFYAFGADKQSPWYRLSVGTCKKEEIGQMLAKLEAALAKLK